MKKEHIVSRVLSGSIAEELGVETGDCLIAVNDTPVEDIFDYQYLCNEEYLTVLIRKPNGEEWELEIEKEFEEDLGMEFENGLMDDYRSCRNKCIFCFIDQMPPDMRDTLYFKDDDSRLSFLQGNYITLTNMNDHDIDRIIRYHLEPINISFQTMNPQLRCEMLHNRFAGEALKKVDRLYEAGIHMNGQIVLCKGINDGRELEASLEKLERYMPLLESVSVVPVGLTKYREGLPKLVPFGKEDAGEVIDLIEKWQKIFLEKYGIHGIHASDEWYLLAGRPLPEEERYDGYLQLENGVGMLRLLENEFLEEMGTRKGDEEKRRVSIATGLLAAPHLQKLAKALEEKYPRTEVLIYPIRNEFFGEMITVSGLLTGQDLKKQLMGKDLGQRLLLPCNLLKSGESVFLDDMTVKELESALQKDINIVKSSGQALAAAMLLEDEVQHLHTDEVNKYE
ncbi:MAG: DUF512 domain-containing protein [Candidatus Limivivens sp.]|nr:DUF512 domain-containing protein [Candidatus Limivivens sp.]